jgi:hypothetical protein
MTLNRKAEKLRGRSSDHPNGLRNYAAERRQGRKISSALAESAMSHLVNQRMGKLQPMRWSARVPIFYCRFAAPYSTRGWIVCSVNAPGFSETNELYHYPRPERPHL